MGIVAIIGALAALGFAFSGSWILAVLVYAAAGFAWIHHDRARPLAEMPVWVAGGTLVAGLVWALWPVRATEAGVQWHRRLRSAERFTVGPERQAQHYGTWDEALTYARDQASVSGEAVSVTDRAWLVRTGTRLHGPKQYWTGMVDSDGTVDRQRHIPWW